MRKNQKNQWLMFVVIAVIVVAPAMAGSTRTAKKTKMDTPLVSCAGSTQEAVMLTVTAAAEGTGAPAGFSVQWMSTADYAANGGWPSDSTLLCKASFSGNANGYRYDLDAGESVTVRIGDLFDDFSGASTNCSADLVCGTQYVFRVFAHANSKLQRSDWTANVSCSTLPCGGCTYTQGYWKTHGPIPTGNNSNEWPVTSMTLGTVLYSDYELQYIFNTPAAGNGLISLAHQLIAAKLNGGENDPSINQTIAAADALIGGLVVPPVGTGSLANSATSALNSTLTSYNEGAIGPGHCE